MKIAFLFLTFLLFGLAVPHCHGQQAMPLAGTPLKGEHPVNLLHKRSQEGQYLKAFLQLTGTPSYSDSTALPFERATYFDVLVQLYNFFGLFEKAARMETSFLEEMARLTQSQRVLEAVPPRAVIDSMTAIPALQAIAEIAEREQVIMINEEHRATVHREMTLELLPVLYQKGFRYLAVETLFTNTDSGLGERKYPIGASGYYTNDPVFGEVIRQSPGAGLYRYRL